MELGDNHLDRLLIRHETPTDLALSWNVRVKRQGLLHKEELHDHAVIRDLSLEGALVEVHERQVHEVGQHVAVRFEGLDGEAVIRHCRPGDGDSLLYGVRFLPDPTFTEQLGAAVSELRGHSSELKTAWTRQN